MIYPITPHVGEEMWMLLGHDNTIAFESWPEYDESKTVENTIEIAVQVNGKLRSTITIAKDSSKEDAIACAKADEKVAEGLDGKSIVKEIYVPGRIVNIVVK